MIGIGKLEIVWDVVEIVCRSGMFGGVLLALVVKNAGWVVSWAQTLHYEADPLRQF